MSLFGVLNRMYLTINVKKKVFLILGQHFWISFIVRSQTRANGPARRQHELGPRRTRRRRGVIARRGELRTGGGVCSRSATPSGRGGPRPTIRRQRRTLLQIEVHSRKQLRGSQTPPHLTTTPQCSNFLSPYLVSLLPIPFQKNHVQSCSILSNSVRSCLALFAGFFFSSSRWHWPTIHKLLFTSSLLYENICLAVIHYWLPCLGLPWRGVARL